MQVKEKFAKNISKNQGTLGDSPGFALLVRMNLKTFKPEKNYFGRT